MPKRQNITEAELKQAKCMADKWEAHAVEYWRDGGGYCKNDTEAHRCRVTAAYVYVAIERLKAGAATEVDANVIRAAAGDRDVLGAVIKAE